MFVTMVIAALIVDGLFSGLGLIPHAGPTRADIFGSVQLDYKLVPQRLGAAVFAALFGLSMRRGATDPVCGMRVDRHKAIHIERAGDPVLCSEHCRETYDTAARQDAPTERAPASFGAHANSL